MTEPRNRNNFLARGGAWVVVQVILMLTVIALGVALHGDWTQLPIIATGALLLVLGGYFGLAGLVVLRRNLTPYPQPREDSELVQRGIYARVRHPLYTSVMLAALGWALLWQSAAAFVAALTLIPFFHAKVRQEEFWLRGKFPGYAAYAASVPRFLPRLRPNPNLVCNF